MNRVIAAYELAMKSEGLKPAYKDVVAPAVISTSDEYDGNIEYEVLRGLVAQFPSMGREELMSNWMGMLNLKRRTSNLLERFEEYLRKAKKELR